MVLYIEPARIASAGGCVWLAVGPARDNWARLPGERKRERR